MFRFFILASATGLGSGLIPVVSGTAGSVVGFLFYWFLKDLPPITFGVTLVTFFLFSVWVSTEAARYLGGKDPQSVVIDEITGFLVTMYLIPFSWPVVFIGFLLFRFFDIKKPFPCRWVEKNLPHGWGIVGDDVVAGIYANLCLQIIVQLLP